jgi:signal transduction histidine kinase
MIPFQFSITPYSFNALALFFIGLAGVFYLLRLQEKTSATRIISIVMLGFTLGMASWLANGIVFWGSALIPFTDACAVVSMSGVMIFAYHYPQKVGSIEARIITILGSTISLVTVVASLAYAIQFVLSQTAVPWMSPYAIVTINGATSLIALVACLRRLLSLQAEQLSNGWRGAISALWHPKTRPIRLLRNFTFALFFGIFQGIATILSSFFHLSTQAAPLIINLSFSLMLIIFVYSIFDITAEQPRLVVRLVGLSLVTVLGLSGIVGMYAHTMSSEWTNAISRADVAITRQILKTGDLGLLPNRIAYILAAPASEDDNLDLAVQHLIYTRSGTNKISLPPEPLLHTTQPAWFYYLNLLDLCEEDGLSLFRYRYGSHSHGTFPQYIGCQFNEGDLTYEVGFDLAEMDQAMQSKSSWVWGLILWSGLLVLVVFPRYFRSNLIRPLDRLLDGVRQADAGSLDIQVPVTYQDEVGFLTSAFNKLAASLKDELAQRERAEAELRHLNLTLEQRVADRTHELEALYDVTAAASQAQDSPSLLTILLERSLAALGSHMGMILLLDDTPATLHLAANSGLPPDWLAYFLAPPLNDALISDALKQTDPLLIPNTNLEPRTVEFIRLGKPLTLILAPLPANGQIFGLMALIRDASQGFDLNEVALLVSIVGQVGAAVHTDRLRQLAQHANLLEERQRLSRDLHDSVTQSLYGLSTLTEAGKLHLEQGDMQATAHMLTRIGQTTRQAIREMRLFLHQLRPQILEQEGLVNALELRLAAVEGRSDVRASLEADETIHLPLEIESVLYHIAQEALNNALKHAGASTVTVHLARTELGVRLTVTDDGCGFDPDQVKSGGMGLDTMRARADEIDSNLEIHSQVGSGTCVSITVEEGL